MRSMVKRSMVLLATAGALFLGGTGAAQAAPATLPTVPFVPNGNCVTAIVGGVLAHPAGAVRHTIARPITSTTDPVACVLKIAGNNIAALPLPINRLPIRGLPITGLPITLPFGG